MDRIEKLLKEIEEDREVWEYRDRDNKVRRIEYSGKFLNDVGQIFERHGAGATKLYLLHQTDRGKYQAMRANRLKRVIDRMEQYQEIRSNRAIGRYVIKTVEILGKRRA